MVSGVTTNVVQRPFGTSPVWERHEERACLPSAGWLVQPSVGLLDTSPSRSSLNWGNGAFRDLRGFLSENVSESHEPQRVKQPGRTIQS